MVSCIHLYYKKLFEKRIQLLIVLLVGLIAFVPALTLLDAQFRNEDEVLTLRVSVYLAQTFQNAAFKAFVKRLITDYHPPARNLVVLPFVLILGANEAVLRLPNILLWVAVCMVAANIGWRLAGFWGGMFSGTFLAVSGLFDLEAMGLGHAGETLWVMLLINLLVGASEWDIQTPQAQKRYLIGGGFCALGFLWFTSLLPICVSYHGIYGYIILRKQKSWQSLKKYLFLTLPYIGFYLVYYAVFLGWPAYLVYSGQHPRPFGQLGQNLFRASTSHLNIISMIQNLRALNWYVLPFLSWILLIAGVIYQVRFYPKIFGILIGYGLIWSFYLSGDTPQHFFAYFCWLLPFGVVAFEKVISRWNKTAYLFVFGTFIVITGAWSYQTHIKTYTYETYPKHLLPTVRGLSLWRNNIDRPMEQMAQQLQEILKPDDQFIVLSDGAFPLYYFRDERYLQHVSMSQMVLESERESQCLHLPEEIRRERKIRAAVSFTTQTFCDQDMEEVIRYNGSNLQITVFPGVYSNTPARGN